MGVGVGGCEDGVVALEATGCCLSKHFHKPRALISMPHTNTLTSENAHVYISWNDMGRIM